MLTAISFLVKNSKRLSLPLKANSDSIKCLVDDTPSEATEGAFEEGNPESHSETSRFQSKILVAEDVETIPVIT